MRKFLLWAAWLVPLVLWFECAVRPVSEPDLFFYFAILDNFKLTGHWPLTDPFVYTLPGDSLMTLHQWLGYWIFYLPYELLGWAGPILCKATLILTILALPLWPFWRYKKPLPDYFPLLWTLVIFITHHRFRERVSLFGDLFTLALVSGLLWARDKRWFWLSLPLLFLAWAQLHPSYPLGWVILLAYFALSGPQSRSRLHLLSGVACLLAPLLNPLGVAGVLYPFQFAAEIEPYLRQYIVEWLPLTDPRLFEFRFLYLPFAFLIPFVGWQLWQVRQRVDKFTWFLFVLGIALNLRSVRFGLIAEGLFLLLIVSHELRRVEFPKYVRSGGWLWPAAVLAMSLFVAGVKLVPRPSVIAPMSSRFRIDTSYFPEAATNYLTALKPNLHVFNSFGFGGYLAWRWGGQPPVFFHGFSTNFKFYEENYNKPQTSQAELDRVIDKYNIGVFILTKLGNDDNFALLLERHPRWQKIYEDQAAKIFAKRSPEVFKP